MEHLDETDRRILTELTRDARISVAELARKVGLSKTPVALRMKQMELNGLIRGYRAVLSSMNFGLSHVTYLEVRMGNTHEAALQEFNLAVRAINEVEECYMTAGDRHYMIKLHSRDLAHFRMLLSDKISLLPHVSEVSVKVAIEAVVEQNFQLS